MSHMIDTTSFHNKKWRTSIPSPGANTMSEPKKVKATTYKDADGYSVYHWPEFQALAKRLMIDLEAPTTGITIKVPVEGLVEIVHTFNGLDATEENE